MKNGGKREEKERIARQQADKIIVTTGDLKEDYEVIGPIHFQVSNKGFFSSRLSELSAYYSKLISEKKEQGLIDQNRTDWGFVWGQFSVGQNAFDEAFFVATMELKMRAAYLGADAIIGMREDIDLDANGFQFFYLQMYGTAVRFKKKI